MPAIVIDSPDNPVEEEVVVDLNGSVIDEPVQQVEQQQVEEPAAGTTGEEEEDGEEEETSVEGEDPAAKTQRNRELRAARKAARKERDERVQAELASRDEIIAQLQEQVNQINKRNIGADISQIDAQLQQLNNAYIQEQRRMAASFSDQDGATHAQAVTNMQEIRDRFNNLQRVRQAVVQRSQQPAPLDPRVQQYAQEWKARNPWYDPSQRDEDSRMAAVIDHNLANEGLNPSTQGYWKEFDRRLARYLPHRANRTAGTVQQRENTAPRRGGPVASGGRASLGAANNANSYRLSPERVKAIQDAGQWNDPDKRKKAIENYMKYDKEHQGA